MEIPRYVTTTEVRRVCRELGLRDWSRLKTPRVSPKEAATVQRLIGGEATSVSAEVFRQGLQVELEHGLTFDDTNVTNNHPLLTGKIVCAHLKESLDYYERLDIAELEGDLLKAFSSRDLEKATSIYKKLGRARQRLAQAEARQLLRDQSHQP